MPRDNRHAATARPRCEPAQRHAGDVHELAAVGVRGAAEPHHVDLMDISGSAAVRGTRARAHWPPMTIARSLVLFVVAALFEIGGAWLVWQGVREHRGLLFIAAGVLALGAYGFVATLQPDPHFGRILAAYGGVFVAGSLAWGVLVDGFRPDRYDITGALICLLGVAVIMYAPR